MVRVHVTQQLASDPDPGVRVLFVRSDNTIAADTITDADGDATATLDAGYITVVREVGTDYALTSVLGIHQGDVIAIGIAPDHSEPTRTVAIQAPARSDGAKLEASTPCTVSSSMWDPTQFPDGYPLPVVTDPACSDAVGVLAIASLPQSNGEFAPVAYSYLGAQDLDAAQSLTLPAWSDAVTTTITIGDFPPEAVLTLANVPLVGAGVSLATQATFAGQTATTHSWTTPAPSFASGLQLDIDLAATTSGDITQYALVKTSGNTVALSFDDVALRWLDTPALSIDAQHEAIVDWTGTGGDTASVAWITFAYLTTASSNVAWDVYMPAPASGAGAGSIVLPVIPDPTLQAVFGGSGPSCDLAIVDVAGKTYDDLHGTISQDLALVGATRSGALSPGSYVLQSLLDRYADATSARVTLSP